jgi:hypothetical protein
MWGFSLAVDEFNKKLKLLVRPSNWIVADESMSSWCPRKSKTGVFPNIYYIVPKPEPLGTPIVVDCSLIICLYLYSHFGRNRV